MPNVMPLQLTPFMDYNNPRSWSGSKIDFLHILRPTSRKVNQGKPNEK